MATNVTGSYNLIADSLGLSGTGVTGGLTNGTNGNQVGGDDPGIGPLAANGGLTQTIALLTGSPAIDAGDYALVIQLTTDQRGTGFVRSHTGTVDIGAFEVQP